MRKSHIIEKKRFEGQQLEFEEMKTKLLEGGGRFEESK